MTNLDLLKTIGNIDDRYIEEAIMEQKKVIPFNRIVKITALAACLALAVGLGVFSVLNSRKSPEIVKIPAVTKQAEPTGMRKFLNYNGYRYIFIGDGTEFDFSGLNLTKKLAVLQNNSTVDLENPDESLVEEDLFTTFAPGGALYEIPTYSSKFRIAVEHSDKYYIAEVAGKVDGSALGSSYFLTEGNISQLATHAVVYDLIGEVELKTLTESETAKLLSLLSDLEEAQLNDAAHEALAAAQAEGKSYRISFVLRDSTMVEFYLTPFLGYISIGDDTYRLPENFATETNHIWDGLAENPVQTMQ